MKRTHSWILMLIGFSALPAQDIQNMDISTLFGYAPSSAGKVPGFSGRLESEGGFAMGILYGYQFAQTKAGGLWLDISQVFSFRDLVDPETERSYSGSSWFFAPGLRYQLPLPNDRFALYTVAGFGYANRNDYRFNSNETSRLQFRNQHSWTVPVGAGFIFRVSQRMGLKAEIRDYLTPLGRGTASSHHNVFLLFGISRHF